MSISRAVGMSAFAECQAEAGLVGRGAGAIGYRAGSADGGKASSSALPRRAGDAIGC